MVTPADLRNTSLLAFAFALLIAAVFQFAGLPSLSTWAMILGGAVTVILRGSAINLEQKQRSKPQHPVQTPQNNNSVRALDENQEQLLREIVREELEKMNETQQANTDPDPDEDLDSTEETDEDRDFDTETN